MGLVVTSVPVSVKYRDGSLETVNVAELTIRQLLNEFSNLLVAGDAAGVVALCCGRPPEWVDTLADESFDALSKKSYELNFRRALDRASTSPIASAKLASVLAQSQRAALELVGSSDGLMNLLEELAPKDSTAATPSEQSTSLPAA